MNNEQDKLHTMRTIPYILYIIVLTAVLAGPSGSMAQSRLPEITFKDLEKKEPADTSGYDERPYFLLIGQSEESLADNDYEAAGLRLVEAMAIEPDNPLNVALLSNLGMIYYYNEQDSLALATLDEAIRRSPRLVGAYENRARVLIGMNHDREAKADYETIIELDSLNVDARFMHGMMSLYDGKLDRAEADFAVLKRIVPLWNKTKLAYATMYSMTDRNREAISLFRELIDREKLPEYYSTYVGCLIAVDSLDEAGKVLGDAIRMFPDDPELYYWRAVLNHKRYMPDDAHDDARRAISLGANPAKVHDIFKDEPQNRGL